MTDLEKDAERYRKLKSQGFPSLDCYMGFHGKPDLWTFDDGDTLFNSPEEAIDAMEEWKE